MYIFWKVQYNSFVLCCDNVIRSLSILFECNLNSQEDYFDKCIKITLCYREFYSHNIIAHKCFCSIHYLKDNRYKPRNDRHQICDYLAEKSLIYFVDFVKKQGTTRISYSCSSANLLCTKIERVCIIIMDDIVAMPHLQSRSLLYEKINLIVARRIY